MVRVYSPIVIMNKFFVQEAHGKEYNRKTDNRKFEGFKDSIFKPKTEIKELKLETLHKKSEAQKSISKSDIQNLKYLLN